MDKIDNQNYLKFIAAAFLLILPFLFNAGNFESPFELFKISAATFYLVPALVLFVLQILKKEKIFIRWNLGLSLAALIVVSSILSYSVSVNPYLSFWGDNLLPSDSLRSILLFFAFALMVSQYAIVSAGFEIYIKALYAVVTISVGYGLLQIYGLDPAWFSIYRAVCGTLGNTAAYALLLGSLAPIVLAVFFTSNRKSVKYFSAALLVLLNFCLFYTSARVPLAVNLVVTVGFLFFRLKKSNKVQSLKSIFLVLIFLVGVAIFFKYGTDATTRLEEKMKSNYVVKAVEMRRFLIHDAYEAWKQKPILGYGPETFSIAQRQSQSIELNKYQGWSVAWVKAHNHLIQALVCTGLFGLLAQLLMFCCTSFYFMKLVLKKGFEKIDYFSAGFYFGYLFLFVSNLTSFNYIPTQLYQTLFPVLFFIGLGKTRNIEFSLSGRLRGLIAILVIVPLLDALYVSFNYWYADTEFQKINYSPEVKNNLISAMKQNDSAIEKNENEPLYYCHKAILIGNFLNLKKATLVDTVKKTALVEIDKNLDRCIQLSVNRDRFMQMKASVYGLLYSNRIIEDLAPSLNSYEQLQKMTPASPVPVLQIGIINFMRGDAEKFKEQMRAAIKLKNDYIPAYIELVNYYYKSNDIEQVHVLAEQMSHIVFYASEQTEYLNDLALISAQNKDNVGEKIFRDLADKYKYFKDIN